MDKDNLKIDNIKSDIKYWHDNIREKSRLVHPTLEHLPEHIKNDYYSFIEAEITRLSIFDGRKNSINEGLDPLLKFHPT